MMCIELFAGPGGMSEGIRRALPDVTALGLEWDECACQTAVAAGHPRIRGDVRLLRWVARLFGCHYLHASPPCQGFSIAGSGLGRLDADNLLAAIRGLAFSHAGPADVEAAMDQLDLLAHDHRSVLTLEPLWWIAECRPEYVTLEQVPGVLPIWEAYAETLRAWGYSVWTGTLNSEQYGVPQTRRRAVLMARLGEYNVQPPVPTHSRYYSRDRVRLDAGVLPWVSMAEALGWNDDDLIGFPRRADDSDVVELGGAEYRARDFRSGDQPAQVVTEKTRSWQRHVELINGTGANAARRSAEDPAPVVHFGARKNKVVWNVNNQSGNDYDIIGQASTPATVVACRSLVAFRGATANRTNGSTKARNDGFMVTAQEAGILQSFPASYPWQGTKTKQHEQVGNAVPPRLAQAIVEALVSWQ